MYFATILAIYSTLPIKVLTDELCPYYPNNTNVTYYTKCDECCFGRPTSVYYACCPDEDNEINAWEILVVIFILLIFCSIVCIVFYTYIRDRSRRRNQRSMNIMYSRRSRQTNGYQNETCTIETTSNIDKPPSYEECTQNVELFTVNKT